jgi:uncharacterized protein
MITRSIQDELLHIIDSFPAVMLYGPRQIGKTTLAKQVAKASNKNFHYFDLENDNDLFVLKNNAFDFLNNLKHDLVIIDEVQTYPPLLSVLRSIIDRHRVAGRFILLGSADPALVKGVSESLAGRIIYTEIFQISLLEAQENGLNLETHWFRGGFPEPLLLKTDKLWKLWTESFISSYVYRDLNQLFGINLSPPIILKIWGMLAHINSELENLEGLGRSLGLTGTTIKKYIDFMEGAYLIRRLPPWYENNGKRLIKSPKIYIRTTGILHHFLQINKYTDLPLHPGVGASWESYVIEQIAACLPNDLSMYFYRTQNGAEIDLVLIKGIKPVAGIEIKYSNSPSLSRGVHECIADLKTERNFVITPSSLSVTTKENIRVVSLYDFLRNELPSL